MSNKERKNVYVHPKEFSDGKKYLNTFGNDGYSFEEKEDDDKEENNRKEDE